MHIFVATLGIAQLALAVIEICFAILSRDPLVLHNVYCAVLFGSGSICLALSSVIARLPHPVGNKSQANQVSPRLQKEVGDIVKVYKGVPIIRGANGVEAEGKIFSGVLSAEKHIDSLEQ